MKIDKFLIEKILTDASHCTVTLLIINIIYMSFLNAINISEIMKSYKFLATFLIISGVLLIFFFTITRILDHMYPRYCRSKTERDIDSDKLGH